MTSHNSPVEESFREAVAIGDNARIKELLVHGMDVNKRLVVEGARDTLPLMMAVEANNIAIIKLLLEHGADVNERLEDGLSGYPGRETAFTLAVMNGNAEIVRLLLKHGADVNTDGDHGSDLLQVVNLSVNIYKIPHYDPEVETLLRQYGAREYANLSDRQIQGMLARSQEGYNMPCPVCRREIKCEADKSGKQWRLFCPTGCLDVYWPKEAEQPEQAMD